MTRWITMVLQSWWQISATSEVWRGFETWCSIMYSVKVLTACFRWILQRSLEQQDLWLCFIQLPCAFNNVQTKCWQHWDSVADVSQTISAQSSYKDSFYMKPESWSRWVQRLMFLVYFEAFQKGVAAPELALHDLKTPTFSWWGR